MSKLQASSEYSSKLSEIELSINTNPTRTSRALRALRKRVSEAQEPERFLACCELLVGRCYQRRGILNNAHKQITKYTRRLDSLGTVREAATGYHYLSQINSSRRDMQSALECCMRGQEIARHSRDWYLLMNFEIDIGPINRGMGDIRAAMVAYKRGLDTYYKHVKGKDKRINGQEEYTEFIITLNIAIQHLNLKEYDKSKEYLDSLSDRVDYILGGAYIDLYHIECGRVRFGVGHKEEGTAHADEVIKRLEMLGKRSLHGTYSNYLGLSDDLLKNGETDRCWRLISLAKPYIERDSTPRIMSILMYVLADYYHAI